MKIRSLLLTAAAFGTPAMTLAQEESKSLTLEEVVVTAERRDTTLQDIPLPVNALASDALSKAGLTSISQIDRVVPDAFSFAGAGTLNVIMIRGVQPGNWDPTTETTVATHIDGAILARSNAVDGHFYDIERMEVLKGPQGTLYGRGATAGAINIITRKPQLGAFGGYAEVEAGNFDRQRLEGAINVPLGEDWAVRAALRSNKHDGYYEDTGFAADDKLSGRLSIAGQVTERLKLLVTADREEIKGPLNTWVPDQPAGSFGSFNLTNVEQPWRNKARWDYADLAKYETTSWGGMLQVDYDLRFATLTAQYSHRELDDPNVAVLGLNQLLPTAFGPQGATAGRLTTLTEFFGVPLTNFTDLIDQNSDSYEVRLASNPGGKLDWIVGLYAFNEEIENYASAGFFVNYFIKPQETESRAVFGQATYSPTDQLHLTLGARYTADDYSLTVDNTVPLAAPVGVAPFEQDASETTWKVNVSYDLTADNMIYAQASTGMKGGHISTTGSFAEPETLTAYEIGSKNQFLDNRLQMNLEAFYYDYDVYQEFANPDVCRVKATPTTCVDLGSPGAPGLPPGPPNGVIDRNIDTMQASTTIAPGGATIYGASLNGIWLLTDNDQVRANVSYTYNKYGSYNRNAAILEQFPDAQFLTPGGDVSDTRVGMGQAGQGSPLRANASYTHTFNFGSGGLDLTADVYYYGESIDAVMRLNEPQQYSLPGRDAYTLFDLSAQYTGQVSDWGDWFIRGYVHNVADDDSLATKTYVDTVAGQQFAPAQSGYITGTYVQPRTYGVVIGAKF
jgi:iron complex outermembrane recepter protein